LVLSPDCERERRGEDMEWARGRGRDREKREVSYKKF